MTNYKVQDKGISIREIDLSEKDADALFKQGLRTAERAYSCFVAAPEPFLRHYGGIVLLRIMTALYKLSPGYIEQCKPVENPPPGGLILEDDPPLTHISPKILRNPETSFLEIMERVRKEDQQDDQ